MQQKIIIFCLIGSGFIILEQFNVFESLFIFLVAGVIPGTNYAVPYQVMLLLIGALIFLTLFRVIASDTFKQVQKRLVKTADTHKKHLPKRRYSQI